MARLRNRFSRDDTIRFGFLAFLIAILFVAIGSAVASDSATGQWIGGSNQSSQKFPPIGEIPDEFDQSRGFEQGLDTTGALERDPDADQTSFQAIFPPDERTRVHTTTQLPYSAIAHIEMYFNSQHVGSCTGTLVGPDALLTSGHCLYTPEIGWTQAAAVIPGRDAAQEPFGYQWASNAWVPEEWFDTQDPYWDWGILRLSDDSLAQQTGWLQIGALTTPTLRSGTFNPMIAGYPGDKLPYGSMWSASKPGFESITTSHLYYLIDTTPGQSGAAILRGSDNVVAGVHMGAVSDANIGMRVNTSLLDDIITGCATIGCSLSYFVEGAEPPPTPVPTATSTPMPTPSVPPSPDPTPATPIPSPSPLPDPPPGQPGNVEEITSPHFQSTWNRSDGPVTDGHISRTWMWGPAPFTRSIPESYSDSPGGEREVQYFDKSRKEITNPAGDPLSIWYVTNGLLAQELITGERQLGDNHFEQYDPAEINVAGDGDDPDGPTYASFAGVMEAGALPEGSTIINVIDRAGDVSSDSALAAYGVTAAYYVPETAHTVASPFWEFMNSSGPIYEQGALIQGNLFENPFYATGFPLTEAYWATVRINNQPQTVLIQVFERRVLTYAPGNPPDWQVEAGNVGIHYFIWRYVLQP